MDNPSYMSNSSRYECRLLALKSLLSDGHITEEQFHQKNQQNKIRFKTQSKEFDDKEEMEEEEDFSEEDGKNLSSDEDDKGDLWLWIEKANQAWEGHNWKEAFHFYKMVQETFLEKKEGIPLVYLRLGLMYENGDGTEEDIHMAVSYYKLGAGLATPDTDCAYQLARIYDFGLGVPEDKDMAILYYQIAADQGQADAMCNLGFLHENGLSIGRDEVQALKYYQLAASKGHAAALCNLASCYEKGKGVEIDKTMAIKLYKMSAEKGNSAAPFYLENLSKLGYS